MSGNTLGAKLYSDGKQIAPMMPDFPDITKCFRCKTIFWLHEDNEIGLFESWEPKPEKWKVAQKAKFLTVYEYTEALENKISRNKADILFIRQRIWWGFNDRVRMKKPLFISESDQMLWFDNAIDLLELLDPYDINQLIMTAELHRNLGEFVKCEAILNDIESKEFDTLKKAFKKECHAKNKDVFLINFKSNLNASFINLNHL